MSQDKRKRRWYQFSLRTFFVLVTFVCVGFGGWVHRSREWIRQRQQVRMYRDYIQRDLGEKTAPWQLRLFGETGVQVMWCPNNDPEISKAMRQLFPEAVIYEYRSGFGLQPD